MSPTPTGPPAPDLNKPAVNKSIDTLSGPSLKFKPFTQLKKTKKQQHIFGHDERKHSFFCE